MLWAWRIYFDENLTAAAGVESGLKSLYLCIKANLFEKVQPLLFQVVYTGTVGNVCASNNGN